MKFNLKTLERCAIGLIFIATVILTATPALAYVMSSTNYRIERDSINFSGSRSTASSYYLESTLGEAGTGIGLSALYKLLAGYQQSDAAAVVVCNNNGTCDSGETNVNCSADCPCDNDGICDAGETNANCPNDCGGGIIPPPPPPPCTSEECPPPTTTPFFIFGVGVNEITSSSAALNAVTNKLATCQFFWGVNTDYADGASSEVIYSQSHTSFLSGLEAETSYHYKLTCRSVEGYAASTGDNQFQTLSVRDVTPPGNVIGLRAVSGNKQVTLYWQNPADMDFAGVIIRRSTDYFPNRSQGVLVYDGVGVPSGSEVSFNDTGLVNDTIYYYSVFAYDTSRNYASGAGVTGQPLEEERPTTTPPIEPPVTPPIEPSPFAGRQDLFFRDFNFFQANKSLPVSAGDRVGTRADYDLSLVLPPSKVLPGTYKMILNLSVAGKIEIYLFAYNSNQKSYSVKLPPVVAAGKYFAAITILDQENKLIKTVSGWLDASEPRIIAPLEIPVTEILGTLSETAQTPAAQTAAAATIAFGIISIALSVPWWNFWYLLQFLFTQPFTFFLLRKGWGTVYNSITKKPIDLALVRLYNAKTDKLITSRVTDKNGRYIFLADTGEYYLKVEKPGFDFPCELLKHVRDDGNYLDLYYGDPIKITGNERSAVIANIPLDQQDIRLTDAQILHRFSRARWSGYLSWLGPILALIYFAINPSWYAGILVLVHLFVLWLIRRLVQGRGNRHWGVVYGPNKKRSVKKAVTRIFSSEYGRMLEFYVTDNYGRYGFLVGNDKYYVTADKEGLGTAKTPLIDLTKPGMEESMIGQDLVLKKTEPAQAPEAKSGIEDLVISRFNQKVASDKTIIAPTVEEKAVEPAVEEKVEEPPATEAVPEKLKAMIEKQLNDKISPEPPIPAEEKKEPEDIFG